MTANRTWQEKAVSLVDLERQQRPFMRAWVMRGFVAASAILILSQQASFWKRTDGPDPFYRNVLNLGASYQRYFAFFYYFGGFPVNLDGQKTSTREEAQATLRTIGKTLTPDRNVYNRASIFLFYPEAFLHGRPDTAEMRTGHAIWFTAGLLFVFGAFCYAGRPLLGLFIALLCGSNPFQTYELYHQGSATIFPTIISTGLVITAACVLLSTERFAKHRWLALVVVCACGIVGALQYEIRLEGVGVFAGALFSLAMCFPISTLRKVSFLCAFIASAYLTSAAINRYFTRGFEKANVTVTAYGGTRTDGGDPYYATQWWALWSGLGDFDEKYGFLADDRAGLSYYYGQNSTTHSEVLMKSNYMDVVTHDPGWFARILRDRMKRVLVENTPYRLSFGSKVVDLKISPWLVSVGIGLALVAASLLLHRTANVNLFVLPLSVGLVAVGQLADYGLQFYVVAHLFLLAYVSCFAIEAGLLLAMLPFQSHRSPNAQTVTSTHPISLT